ncbi:M23 family metallopeptidase [Agrococcus sp. Marseille-Q4369]|uniref:M23 family metallopeptidase n=1 Tax=Agrococcus sp. Marseille-Q4369 TaxID=2810513 RepID=UPI001B8C10D6|nr:M23 family metallopeptidase [Agrococcus sp. Marseille-Q4369]QUW18902.1 M23 family metallopeptidase [Agrococcus sp. Marseille-Q4369]
MYASPLRIPLIRTGKYGKRAPVLMPGGKVSANDHEGVDTRAPVGTPVYPVIGGTVIQVIDGWASPSKPGRSYGRSIFRPGGGGNQVVYRGDDGRDHNDGHLSDVLVKPGQRVETGTMIARTGRTGVFAAHLHHGVWIEHAPNRWRSIDPTPLLPWSGDVFGELKPATTKTENRLPDPIVAALTREDDDMRIIQAPNRGLALVGAGYYSHIRAEFLSSALAVWGPSTEVVGLNDRQFDEARALATQGTVSDALNAVPTAIAGVLDAVRAQASAQGVDLDESELATSLLHQGLAQEMVDALVNRAR